MPLQFRPTQYASQEQPVDQFGNLLGTMENRYAKNSEQEQTILDYFGTLDVAPGDVELRSEIAGGVDQAYRELIDSSKGGLYNPDFQTRARGLTRQLVSDPRLLALAQTSANYKQAQKLRQQADFAGESLLFDTGDPTTTINPETGRYIPGRFGGQQQLDWLGQAEKSLGKILGESGEMPPELVSLFDDAVAGIRTGRYTGRVTEARTDERAKQSIFHFLNSDEGKQLLRVHEEQLGRQMTEEEKEMSVLTYLQGVASRQVRSNDISSYSFPSFLNRVEKPGDPSTLTLERLGDIPVKPSIKTKFGFNPRSAVQFKGDVESLTEYSKFLADTSIGGKFDETVQQESNIKLNKEYLDKSSEVFRVMTGEEAPKNFDYTSSSMLDMWDQYQKDVLPGVSQNYIIGTSDPAIRRNKEDELTAAFLQRTLFEIDDLSNIKQVRKEERSELYSDLEDLTYVGGLNPISYLGNIADNPSILDGNVVNIRTSTGQKQYVMSESSPKVQNIATTSLFNLFDTTPGITNEGEVLPEMKIKGRKKTRRNSQGQVETSGYFIEEFDGKTYNLEYSNFADLLSDILDVYKTKNK
ncbi:hypothetical protein LCGC14_0246390 [marine sediment metagenome]|uniref:Uncharacterized protein n=1 Tax=marine sediment metagenome TaxID=412755 RepID=A0A0F9XAR6_9ZZZZ